MKKIYIVLVIFINLFCSNIMYSQLSDNPKLNEDYIYQKYREMILNFDQSMINQFANQRGFGVSQIRHLGDRQYSITYINLYTGKILRGGTYNGNQKSVISFEEFKENEVIKRQEEIKKEQLELERKELEKLKRKQDSIRISDQIIQVGITFNDNLKKDLTQSEEKDLEKYLRKNSKSIEMVPQFKNCIKNDKGCFQENMIKIISENFVYPERGRVQGIEGEFRAMFVINEKGLVENVRFKMTTFPVLEPNNDLILDFINYSLQIISKIPVLYPPIKNGVPTKIPFSIPWKFKLSEDL